MNENIIGECAISEEIEYITEETKANDLSNANFEQQQSLISAGIWQTLGGMLSGFFSWILVLIVARRDIGLGPEGVGVLSVGSVIFTLAIVIPLGIKKSMAQKISSNCLNKVVALKEAKNGTFTIILISIAIGTGLLITSFLRPSPLTFQDKTASILFLTGIGMFIIWYREVTQGILSGVGEYDSIAKSIIAFFFIQLVSGVLLTYLIKFFDLPISLILFCYLFGFIVQVLFLFKYIRKHQHFNAEIFRFGIYQHEVKKNLHHGFLFAITEIIPLNIVTFSSILVLFLISNNYEITGAYSIVGGYATAGLILIQFTWPLITHIAEAYSKTDFEKIRFNLTLVLKLFFTITFLVLAVYIGASYKLVYVFYGSEYLTGLTDIWIPFIIVMAASTISAFEYIICCVLLGIGKRKQAAVYLGSLILVVNGLIVLFLKINLFTPLINTSLGYLIGVSMMLPITPYLLGKEIKQKISYSIGIRSFLALICTLSIAIPLNLNTQPNILTLILSFAILGFIYMVLLIFFGAMSKEDFDLLEKKLEGTRLQKILILSSFIRKLAKKSPFSQSEKIEE